MVLYCIGGDMIIKYLCNNPDCKNHISKYYKSFKEVAPFLDCGACGSGKLERQIGAPTTKSTQFVDNGLQARRVELISEVVEKERNKRN